MKNIRKRIVTKEPGLTVQVTARELVSELMKPATVIASGKAVIDYLYTLPLSPAVCTKLVSMIGDHVLDAEAWAFDTGFVWGVAVMPVKEQIEEAAHGTDQDKE
jgi:hypothetical protein